MRLPPVGEKRAQQPPLLSEEPAGDATGAARRNSPRGLCVKARAKKEQPQAPDVVVECVRASLNWNAVAPSSLTPRRSRRSALRASSRRRAHAGSRARCSRGGAAGRGREARGRRQAMPCASAVAGCLPRIIHRSRERETTKPHSASEVSEGGLWTVRRRSFCYPAGRQTAAAVALPKKKKKGIRARLRALARSLLTCRRRHQYAHCLVRGDE